MNKLAIIAVSSRGLLQAKYIQTQIPSDLYILDKYFKDTAKDLDRSIISFDKLSELVEKIFGKYEGIIFIMAQGIVSRVISPLLKSKYTDPAIVTCDDSARFAISTASGHERGANELAYLVSSVTGATPVITTATESNKGYVVGVGSRKDVKKVDVIEAIRFVCHKVSIDINEVRLISSAWLKADEIGILEAASELNIYTRFLPKSLYDNYAREYTKTAAQKYFDIPGVAEPSAILSAHNATLLVPATNVNGVVVAVAKDNLLQLESEDER